MLDDIVVDIYHLEVPPSCGTRLAGGVREIAHVVQLVCLPLHSLSYFSSSLQNPADRTFTIPCEDVFPEGMANQRLPLKNPLPPTMTLDLTSLWDIIDESLVYW